MVCDGRTEEFSSGKVVILRWKTAVSSIFSWLSRVETWFDSVGTVPGRAVDVDLRLLAGNSQGEIEDSSAARAQMHVFLFCLLELRTH